MTKRIPRFVISTFVIRILFVYSNFVNSSLRVQPSHCTRTCNFLPTDSAYRARVSQVGLGDASFSRRDRFAFPIPDRSPTSESERLCDSRAALSAAITFAIASWRAKTARPLDLIASPSSRSIFFAMRVSSATCCGVIFGWLLRVVSIASIHIVSGDREEVSLVLLRPENIQPRHLHPPLSYYTTCDALFKRAIRTCVSGSRCGLYKLSFNELASA